MRWKDIDEDEGIIHIVNNYVDSEGDKECKRGSNRDVLLPSAIKEDLAHLRENSPHPFPDDYVMFNLDNRKVPCSVEVPRLGFVRMLEAIGITKEQQKERNLTFHGMRHTFVTLARMAGLPDITVQALAGHKSAEMMNRYSHANQVIDFNEARKKLERHEKKIAE
jgi:integrase